MRPSDELHGIIGAEQAVEGLRQGHVVAIPTETVYGLAADISNPAAILKIFQEKQRPFFDPLIVHVADADMVAPLVAHWPPVFRDLAERFWPGPLTLVAKKTARVDDRITAGLDTVGVRWPRQALAHQIIRSLGRAIAAPSANRFGKTSPTTAQHVLEEFGGRIPVVDGGACEIGIESTIVSCDEAKGVLEVLRPGAVTLPQLAEALAAKGHSLRVEVARRASVPGQLAFHYQPDRPLVVAPSREHLRMAQEEIRRALSLAGWRPFAVQLDSRPELAARDLYSQLRRGSTGDVSHLELIWSPTGDEAWRAVGDRIEKALSARITGDGRLIVKR